MDSMRRNAQKMMPHVMALNKKPTMGMKNDRQPAPAVSKLVAYAKGGKVMAKGGAADKKQDKSMLARHNRLMHPGQKSKLAKGGTVATGKNPAYDKADEDAFYAAMKAEKSFRSAYGDKANKSVKTTGTNVAAQKPIRASKKQSDMGLTDDDTYERSNRAEKSAKKILDGYTHGGMVKKYANGKGVYNKYSKEELASTTSELNERDRVSKYKSEAEAKNKAVKAKMDAEPESITVTAKKPSSFGEAFKAARKEQGAGGTFTFNGKKYSTNKADDSAVEAVVKYNKKKDPSTESAIRQKFAEDLGMKKGGKVKAKGDKKKVMGTVGEAKSIMAALKKARRPATPMPGTPMAGLGMAPPMKHGGKVMKKAAGGAAKLRKS